MGSKEKELNASRPQNRPNRIIVAFFLTISFIVIVLLSRTRHASSTSFYAVCSASGSHVYTVDSENRVTECLVVAGTDIVDTGSLVQVTERSAARGLVLDNVHYIPDGAIITPSFTDSHVHSLEYGFHRLLPLDDADSVPAVVDLVKSFILSNPSVLHNTSKWIYGWGFDRTQWPSEDWPNYKPFEGDPLTKGRPIWLTSKDGHAIWTSKKVIELAEQRLPGGQWPEEVEGGVIFKDEDGKPNGIFLDNAQSLIYVAPPEEDNFARFKFTVEDALANGLTAMHDAGFLPETLEFYEKQIKKGNLPIRMYAMHNFNPANPYWGNTTKRLDHNRLKMRSVKLICDGAMRSGGAYLYEPYTDDPTNVGFMRLSPSLLNSTIPRFLKDGWQVNAHAIGDKANGLVLDAFERAIEEYQLEQHSTNKPISRQEAITWLKSLRPRIEHAQIMTPSDLVRIGELGVIASIQPTHATDDMWYGEAKLGPERVRGLFAFRTMMDGGARITLGSDIPVEGINPLEGFYAAITRADKAGNSPHGPNGWFPDQKLTRVEALRGITIDPAYASFSDDILGSLEPGKKADFVVLSKDINVVPTREILDTKVLVTVLDGKIVYRDEKSM
ncbi:amidohydrolase family-domain-containing protein [Rhodocollybia butyracea]|uniref:Amidohydrolase family-domain-containing protein n=1 Tax=Rhodocollybia butyracea TaxID=206335 RepID=A0A9P5QB25_9AGAR|nr:amidohydrolase family-domain-containing protein [Rhodocollybia butyracea]